MRPTPARVVATLIVLVASLGPAAGLASGSVTTARVSVTHTGAQADRPSGAPSLSSDGRFVAFVSDAAQIVPGDTNNAADVFLLDRRTGVQRRISVNSQGIESRFTDPTKAPNASPAVTPDGRFIAFSSGAWNLVTGDTNELSDIFVRDRIAGTTVRASIGVAGAQPNGHSVKPALSDDGRFVAFESSASNLIGDDTNGAPDIFVRDLQTGTMQRVSVRWDGAEVPKGAYGVPAINADGRYVAFHSVERIHPYDRNGIVDVYVYDRQAATALDAVQPASLDASGQFANGNTWDDVTVADPVIDMSADGRFVAFESGTPTLVNGDSNAARDIFVRDRTAGVTSRVSLGATSRQLAGASRTPSISDDGRMVSFVSDAADAVGSDANAAADVFVRDTTAGTTVRASLSAGGAEADGPSASGDISGDGSAVGFSSLAKNLVATDTNTMQDVFLRGAPLPAPPPTPTITSPAHGSLVQSASVGFAGTAAAGTTVRVIEGTQTLGSGTTQANGTWTLSATLADGAHSVMAIASANGVDSEATPLRSFTVDTSGPPLSGPVITHPGLGTLTNSSTINAAGTADPNVSITLTEGAVVLGATTTDPGGRWAITFTTTEGQHAIVATASDGTNEVSSPARTFTVDLTQPAVPQILSPVADDVVYANPVTISGTSEPKATVYIYWESLVAGTVVAGTNGSWSKAITVAEGENEVVVRARDAAGNFGPFGDPHPFMLTVDSSPPTVTFNAPSYNAYTPGTPTTFEGLAQDNVKVEKVEVVVRNLENAQVAKPPVTCSSCGSAQTTWSATALLSSGVYRVYAYAYDAAGLRSAQTFITIVRL